MAYVAEMNGYSNMTLRELILNGTMRYIQSRTRTNRRKERGEEGEEKEEGERDIYIKRARKFDQKKKTKQFVK